MARAGESRLSTITGVTPLIVLLLALVPLPMKAQSDTLPEVLAEVPDSAQIRVQLTGRSSRPVGKLAAWNGGSLALCHDGGASEIPLSDIERLWIAKGDLGSRGLWIGALVGAGAGFSTVVLGYAGLYLAAPGALIGAGAGYLHGRQQTDWRLRYEVWDGRVALVAEVRFP